MITGSPSPFVTLLQDQVEQELTASQQQLASAVWFDAADLPRLAHHVDEQSAEERGHALVVVQHLLDRDVPVTVPGIDAVRNDVASAREVIALALEQERHVTRLIEGLFRAARAEDDALGEQVVLWFLEEQVEEAASSTALLDVADRAGDDLFHLEDFIVREVQAGGPEDSSAPPAAGH